jgi:hypothetical protein
MQGYAGICAFETIDVSSINFIPEQGHAPAACASSSEGLKRAAPPLRNLITNSILAPDAQSGKYVT